MFGYSVRHVHLQRRELDVVPLVKEHPGFEINPPRAVSLGVHCLQGVLVVPQSKGLLNQECGLGFRLCRKMPPIRSRTIWQFRGYMRYFCKILFPQPLSPDTDFSASEWLKDTKYPLWRCAQLLKLVVDIPQRLTEAFFKKFGSCKAFIKLENYANGTVYEWGDYKPPRVISSRTDHVKVAVGPIIKAIEKVAYRCPFFIKHIPIPERPSYILQHVATEGCRYLSSDYTSFECGFTPAFMTACEFFFYRYMLSNCPEQLSNIRQFQKQCTGTNRVHMRDVSCYMRARRQSGEMTTSLGNGISNLAMTAFLLRDVIDITRLRGVVEGDDGLFAIPKEHVDRVRPECYADFGFLIKSEWHDTVSDASFCGLVFDDKDLINIVNPVDEILSVGWSLGENIHASDRRIHDLLVAKTWSLAYEYSGCPIIFKMARWLSRTAGNVLNMEVFNSREWNEWDRWRINDMLRSERTIDSMLAVSPSIRSRLLMERIFGVSVGDQLSIEAYFDSLKVIQPIDLPLLHQYVSPAATDNLKRVFTFHPGSSWEMINDYYPD